MKALSRTAIALVGGILAISLINLPAGTAHAQLRKLAKVARGSNKAHSKDGFSLNRSSGVPSAAAAAFFLSKIDKPEGRIPIYITSTDEGKWAYINDASKVWYSEADASGSPTDITLQQILSDEGDSDPNDLSRFDIYVERNFVTSSSFTDYSHGKANLYLVNHDGSASKVEDIDLGPNRTRCVCVNPGLMVRLDSDDPFGDMEWLKQQKFRRSDTKFLSFFDTDSDLEAVEVMKRAGIRNIDHKDVSLQAIADEIAMSPGKNILLTGHIEGGTHLVGRNAASEEVFKVSIDELSRVATHNQATLTILGCESATTTSKSGFIHKVNSIQLAQQIDNAMRAKTYEEFLSSLGTEDAPFVVHASLAGQVRIITAQRQERREMQIQSAITTVKVTTTINRPIKRVKQSKEKDKDYPWWSYPVVAVVLLLKLFIGSFIRSAIKSANS